MIEPVPHCYRHHDRETLIRCVRCDRPICPDCMRDAPVGFQCPDDASAGARSVPARRTAVGAVQRPSPPYVTIGLIVINVAVYLITGLRSAGGLTDPTRSTLFDKLLLVPNAVVHQDRYYELVTSGFLHLSLTHIGLNMVSLWFIGPYLEANLGRWRMASLYLLALLGGSAAVFVLGQPNSGVAGASGAIFGLFAACLLLARRLGLNLQYLVVLVVLNFAFTFTASGISALGHIGGFVTGGLATFAIAGLPGRSRRLATSVQGAGLGALLAVLVAIIAIRAATWG